ncbi:hypothetical protein [Polycladidibacter stylochi]|uniref:hypothetical protein n=1 Tax=Polycladidibacter stylochi TaxID=1807766 RepID=UPI00082C15B0|nr:hypothetical protein [Pseudovibrio stylochi]
MHPRDIFTLNEMQAIKRCIALSIEDDLIFPNWEFQILTGASLEEARSTLNQWPDVELTKESVRLTVRGILVNLLGYPHGKESLILSETGLKLDDIERLFAQLPKE